VSLGEPDWRRRVVIGVALAIAYPILLGVPAREMVAATGVVAIESAVFGVVPFGLAFIAQLALGPRRLHDGACLLVAFALVLAWWLLGHGLTGVGPGEVTVAFGMSVLLLWWFMGAGAASARALRRRRSAGPSSTAPEA